MGSATARQEAIKTIAGSKYQLNRINFKGTNAMSFDRTHTCAKDGYNLTMCNINTHAGTHTDAPLHFLADGKSLAEVDIQCYVGPCFVVDCTQKNHPNAFLTVADAAPFEAQIKRA